MLNYEKPNRRFIAVVGASGVGKSSLIYAGLLPRLEGDAIEGSSGWPQICFKPAAIGNNPFLSLAAALKRQLPPDETDEAFAIAAKLAEAPERVTGYGDRVLASAPESARLLLFVDQAEELFAQSSVLSREPFVHLLAEAAGHDRVQVILTLRADFLPQATSYPRLADLLQTGTFVLGPPGPAGLADMIREPGQLAGVALDDDLANAILRDVGCEPGALPLAAFCLQTLFESSGASRHLTLKAYDDLDRLKGSVRRRADQILLSYREREGVDLDAALSRLFRALVHIDASGTPARQTAVREALIGDPTLKNIVPALEHGRLLVAGAEDANVSLAHEVLFSAWPELASWVEERRPLLQRLDLLQRMLASGEATDREQAVLALGQIGLESVPALANALSHEHWNVRSIAAGCLWRLGPEAAAVPALAHALSDEDRNMRNRAAEGLAKIGSEAVPALINALSDEYRHGRISAAWAAFALGKIGLEAAAVPALINALSDEDGNVRITAAEALGQIGREAAAAVPALYGS